MIDSTHSDGHTLSPKVVGCMDSTPDSHPSLSGFPSCSAENFLFMAITDFDSSSYYMYCAILGVREDKRITQDSSHPAEGTTQLGKPSERLALNPHSGSHSV